MSLRLITPAATYPVTLDEAKAQCRVDGNDDNSLITSYIYAATAYVEQVTGRALISQTWELLLDDFSDAMLIPKGPVSSVTSVTYYDADGQLQTVSDTNYATDLAADPQWIVRASDYSWPQVADGINNVIIRFVAGYAILPDTIKAAILILIASWYDARSTGDIPPAVDSLLCNSRSFA